MGLAIRERERKIGHCNKWHHIYSRCFRGSGPLYEWTLLLHCDVSGKKKGRKNKTGWPWNSARLFLHDFCSSRFDCYGLGWRGRLSGGWWLVAARHALTQRQTASRWETIGRTTHALEQHAVEVHEAMPPGCSHIYSSAQHNTSGTSVYRFASACVWESL